MDDKKKLLSEKEELEVFCKATSQAIKNLYKQGLPAVDAEEKGIFKAFPDGHKECVKPYVKERGENDE